MAGARQVKYTTYRRRTNQMVPVRERPRVQNCETIDSDPTIDCDGEWRRDVLLAQSGEGPRLHRVEHGQGQGGRKLNSCWHCNSIVIYCKFIWLSLEQRILSIYLFVEVLKIWIILKPSLYDGNFLQNCKKYFTKV